MVFFYTCLESQTALRTTWRSKPLSFYWPDIGVTPLPSTGTLGGNVLNDLAEAMKALDGKKINRNSGPVSIKPSFPTALFQVGGFHIQCFEQPWSQPTLTLVERPSIDHGLLRRHLTLHPHHRQLIESYLSPCLPQNSSIEIGTPPKLPTTMGVSIAAP